MDKESTVHVYSGILKSEIMKSVGEWIVLENILLDEVNTAYSPSSGVRGSKSLDVSLSPGGMVRGGILGRGNRIL